MLKLFQDIKLTKGYTRSVLQDFTRDKYYLIPNLLAKFIEKYDAKKELSEITLSYGKRYPALFQDYYGLLMENELVFDIIPSQIIYFEEINDEYESPFILDCITFFLTIQNYEGIKHAIENNFFKNVTNYRIIISRDVAGIDFLRLFHSIERFSPASCFISLCHNNIDQQELENLSKTYSEIIRYEYIEQKSDVCVFKFQDDQQIPLISNSIFGISV